MKLDYSNRVINASLFNSTEPTITSESHGHPASFEAQIALSVIIGILAVWSTTGNSLTIMAILMHKTIITKCNYFILSLAVSDLISGAIASPLWLYRRTWGFEDWLWGDFLCKLFWFVDESTSYCTAMHIASFAVWRYIGVKWPHSFEKLKKRTLKIYLCVIWCIAVVFGGAVFSRFYGVENRSNATSDKDHSSWPSCSIITADHGVKKHLIYYTFSSATFMLLPMVILFVFSTLIIRELFWLSNVKSTIRKAKERKAVCQLALISASFLAGYIPMNAYVMWTTRTPKTDYRVDYWIHVAAYLCLRISECLNPIVYNIASSGMRKASKEVLRYIRNCCRRDAERNFSSHSLGRNHRRRMRSSLNPSYSVDKEHSKNQLSSGCSTFLPTKESSNSLDAFGKDKTLISQQQPQISSKAEVIIRNDFRRSSI